MKLLLKNCYILAGENDGYKVLKNAFLGINGDTIDYIGEVKPTEKYDTEKDMTNKLLIPGLINCHNHAPMTLLRGVGSDLPLQEWLFEKMMPVEDRFDAHDIKTGNYLALLEMLSTGTTSYCDMYFMTENAIENAIESGIKANLCRPIQCFDGSETYAQNYRAKESIALFKAFNGCADDRVRIDFGIHAEYTNFDHIVRAYADECKEYNGRMHIHLSETKKEHDECIQRHGKTPTEWFNDLGVFDIPTLAAHCVWVTEGDMEIIKAKGVSPVHNPDSNLKLGSGIAPVPKMLEMGINVALGTDGAASNNNLNLMEEMHLAAVMHNGYNQDPVMMNPTQIINMATRNGAKLQGRDDTGVLEVGKKADIAAIDLDRPHLYPVIDVPALVTYSAQGSDIVMTMVNGKILYENGEFLTLDKDRIMFEARKSIERLYN